ncbi:hypothetical protein [Nocardia tengchongensis]
MNARNLTLAPIAFALTFWAWNLTGPLSSSYTKQLDPSPAGLSLSLMAFFLGAGGVFALIAQLVDPTRVGTVTGLVGAAGGLGGYFPPLVMGAVYSASDEYTFGYILLALTAVAVLLFTLKIGREFRPNAEPVVAKISY